MPRARRKSVSATPRTLSEETKTALKTYLKQFVEGLIQETVRWRSYRDTEEALPSGRGTIKPFHEAILPSRVRAISEFERSFSTRLGSTFEACAQIIAAQYHKHAQRGYKLQASVSRRALEEVNMQIRAFESMATQAQRLRFDDMVAAVLFKASNDDTVELSITADLYILRHDGTELFFEIKSPQPNKGQCLEVTQRLLRIHLARQKPRPQVQAYFAMPYNPYGTCVATTNGGTPRITPLSKTLCAWEKSSGVWWERTRPITSCYRFTQKLGKSASKQSCNSSVNPSESPSRRGFRACYRASGTRRAGRGCTVRWGS
jgi:hypothetical protein